MKFLSNQSWLAWVLIVTQMTFGAFGYGRVIVCNDDEGQSHVELALATSLSRLVDTTAVHKGCDQLVSKLVDTNSTHCTSTQCVDEVLSFTFTINTPRKIGCGSLLDVVPTGPPAILDWPNSEPTPIAWIPCDDLNDAFALLGLRRSVRSTVMNL